MNTFFLEEDMVKEKLRQQWAHWVRQRRLYPHLSTWLEMYAKKKIRHFYIQERSEHRWDFMRMDNFHYDCICDFLLNAHPYREKRTVVNHLKAKITNLLSKRLQRVLLDNDEPNKLVAERAELFHVIQMCKRRES
jgi:hypothetical protein